MSIELITLMENFLIMGYRSLIGNCPRAKDPPMAKKDNDGNIITAPSLIRKLYIETYCHRLRQRKIRPRY